MRIQVIFFSLLLCLLPIAAIAGSNHDHGHGHSHDPVSQGQAEKIALDNVSRLIEKGKIDKSWKTVAVAKAEKKKFGGNMEWVISFKNESVSEPDKQTLYIFLGLTGEYIAANYTGK